MSCVVTGLEVMKQGYVLTGSCHVIMSCVVTGLEVMKPSRSEWMKQNPEGSIICSMEHMVLAQSLKNDIITRV